MAIDKRQFLEIFWISKLVLFTETDKNTVDKYIFLFAMSV